MALSSLLRPGRTAVEAVQRSPLSGGRRPAGGRAASLALVALAALGGGVGVVGCKGKTTATEQAAEAARPGAGKLDAPTVGAAQPKVDVLAFVDFECPFCRGQGKALLDMVDKHKGAVRLRFFNLPLDVHPNSVLGAQAAVAAHRQNAYFAFYGKMMADVKLDRDAAVAWSVAANLDPKKFAADLDSPEVAKVVARDVALAKALGVHGTPSFVVNGVLVQGAQPPEAWDKRIAEEVARAEALLAAGTKPADLIKSLVAANNPSKAADYVKYVVQAEAAPAAEVPAKVGRSSGVASAQIAPVGGGTGAVQIGEPIQLGADFHDAQTVWRVAVRPDDPAIGPASAPVTLVVFEDMECPFCAKLRPVVAKLVEAYGPKLRVVFKHNPLPFHKNAELAAVALEAARAQGKFWELHDTLLAHQDKLGKEALQAHADKLGLNRGQFDTALAALGGKDRIEADVEQAAAIGARGTPNLFVNGRRLVGAKEEAVLREIIDAELKHADELVKAGTPADGVYEAIIGKGKLLDSLSSEAKAIDVGDAATRGPVGAAVHIVTFQDFQCPFSARLDPHIAAMEQEFPGRVKITWLDFPLSDIHPLAQTLAEAGQEARKQGKFWEFHKEVMADNSNLDEAALLARAKKAGLDVKALQAALKDHRWADAVAKQRKLGEDLGVKGTPSVFVNGHQFVPQTGFSAGTFRAAIHRLLGAR